MGNGILLDQMHKYVLYLKRDNFIILYA